MQLFLTLCTKGTRISLFMFLIHIHWGLSTHLIAQTYEPEDFGYNAIPTIGETPLLIILLEFQDERFDVSHTASYYQELFFGTSSGTIEPNIGGKGGYFYQNSNSKFWYKNEGVLGPYLHPLNGNCARGTAPGCEANLNTIQQNALDYANQAGFDFASYDANGNNNGVLEATELTIHLIEAGPLVGGAYRGSYSIPGLQIPGISASSQYASTDIITHELTHAYGTIDVYGTNCNNNNYSLLSCSDFAPDSRYTKHMDPYHKMILGWTKPVLIPNTEINKTIDIWAAELPQLPNNKLFLIYDPNRDPKEFYLLENRFTKAIDYYNSYYVPINSWWSPSRRDNFATTQSDWMGFVGDLKSPDYLHYRLEGFAFHPWNPRPPDVNPSHTTPLYSWWSPSRGDNFMTSDPNWSGSPGDVKNPDYEYVRLAGFVYKPDLPQPEGTIPLYSWWNPITGDNFLTSDPAWSGDVGDTEGDYTLFRKEGYIPSASFHNYDKDAWGNGEPRLPDQGVGAWHVLEDPQSTRLRWIPSVTTGNVGVGKLPLNVWYSPAREEHITTTQEDWQWYTSEAPDSDYRLVSIDGYLTPPNAQPSSTEVPLYSWWNPNRGDNFTTTDPAWSGNVGDVQSGYTLYKIEGYVESLAKPGYDTLFSWWNSTREDNFLTTQWSGNIDGTTGKQRSGYINFRIEGFIEKSTSPNDFGLLIEPPVGEAGLSPTNSLWEYTDQRAYLNWFDGSIAFNFDVNTPIAGQPVVEVIINSLNPPTSIAHSPDFESQNIIQAYVFPNPITNHQSITLEYSLPDSGPHEIRLLNIQGQILQEIRKETSVKDSTQSVKLLSDQNLPSGMYMIQLVQNNRLATARLMVR